MKDTEMGKHLLRRGAILVLAMGGLWLAKCAWFAHSTDLTLERNFYRYEVEFAKLIEMCNQDAHVTRITLEFTWLDKTTAWPRPESELGFSKERWAEYRHLFKKLGIKHGLFRGNGYGADVFLMVSATGMVTGGTEKGYAYSTKEPSPLFDSLEHISVDDVKSLQPAFKRIKGNWYLYYMWDD